jgi:hypothetical protein
MEKIMFSGQWSPDASPALLSALQEMVLLAHAQVSKPILPAVDEPHKESESAEQHPADDATNN